LLDRTLFPVGQRVHLTDSTRLQLFSTGDDRRLTVLRKEVPPWASPARDYPTEAVLKRPLLGLTATRNDAVTPVASMAAYLALVAILAWAGRKKTALGLLALFILLPAYLALFGLFLVLVLLVAALPWRTGPKDQRRPLDLSGTVYDKIAFGLLILPAALLVSTLLGGWTMKVTVWTYLVVLVPLIVLAVVGRKKAALCLLVSCLLLLLYLNWPSHVNPVASHHGGILHPFVQYGYEEADYYLLNFHQLISGSVTAEERELLPYEAWDWSDWYWLWPNQCGSWRSGYIFMVFPGRSNSWLCPNPLVLALVLLGGVEFLRRNAPKVREKTP
jgi:hypothetical protein